MILATPPTLAPPVRSPAGTGGPRPLSTETSSSSEGFDALLLSAGRGTPSPRVWAEPPSEGPATAADETPPRSPGPPWPITSLPAPTTPLELALDSATPREGEDGAPTSEVLLADPPSPTGEAHPVKTRARPADRVSTPAPAPPPANQLPRPDTADPPRGVAGDAVTEPAAVATHSRSGRTLPQAPPDLAPLAAATTETHHAAAMHVTAQIADALRTAAEPARDMAQQPATATAPVAPAPRDQVREKLQVLVIDLQPERLGAVQVRLRLLGGEMCVHLLAEHVDTAHAISGDRTALADRLEAAGYQLAQLDVATLPRLAGARPDGWAQARDDLPRDPGRDDRERNRRARREDHHEPRRLPSRPGDLRV